MKSTTFSENTKMADALLANDRLLWVLPHFDIELGFGEKTIRQVCTERGLSAPLVVLVCNLYTFDDWSPDPEELKTVPIEGIVNYLERSHRDYLNVRVPHITEAVQGLAGRSGTVTGNMLAAFCEKYRQEVIAHFRYEEEVVFPYIRQLLAGGKADYKISEYETSHSDIEAALEDLKNIIIKYLPEECPIEQCRPVLSDLYAFEEDLRRHTLLEDTILIPLVERLDAGGSSRTTDSAGLSERERETLAAVARGMSNKQIADSLFISPHTVISHRKNIVRKTGIKTVSGLTLYALLNGLISQDDLR